MTTDVSIEMSWCRCISANPVRRSFLIVDLMGVLILFSLLNECSDEHDVTGRVHKIVSNTLMLVNIPVA